VKWTTHGERTIYDSPWVRLSLVDVELPSGKRFDHHVVRAPGHASGVVIFDPELGVLLLWRHRFTTDTWGWEVPAGRIDDGETPIEAARREALEETGWEPGPITELIGYHPNNGQSDLVFHLFLAAGATYVGPPSDPDESERVEWVPLDRLRTEIAEHRMRDGLSLTAVLWALTFGALV
jgi:8-oxo-dGTP pyrophosphatase MutT (NUDIX family)